MQATFSRYRGVWCLRVEGDASPGDLVTAVTAKGDRSAEQVTAVLWSGADKATGARITLCEFSGSKPASAPRRTRRAAPPAQAAAPTTYDASTEVDVFCDDAHGRIGVCGPYNPGAVAAYHTIIGHRFHRATKAAPAVWDFPIAEEHAVLRAVATHYAGATVDVMRSGAAAPAPSPAPQPQAATPPPRPQAPPPPPKAAPLDPLQAERLARSVLGMSPGERTEDGVRKALRKLIGSGAVKHPDQGGDPVAFKNANGAAQFLARLYSAAARAA
jgi:hypothetical protein